MSGGKGWEGGSWLVGWVAGWLVGWLLGWLAGWLVAWLAGWSVGRLVGRLLLGGAGLFLEDGSPPPSAVWLAGCCLMCCVVGLRVGGLAIP